MDGLNEAFLGVTLAGIYESAGIETKPFKYAYRAYFCILAILTTSIFLLMSYSFVALIDNMDDFVETSFLYAAGLNALMKCFNFRLKRDSIQDLRVMLADELCLRWNEEEAACCLPYDRLSRYMVLGGIMLANFTGTCLIFWPILFLDKREFPLMLMDLYPFEIDNDLLFYCIYLHQSIACIAACMWNASIDCLLCALMIQIAAQFELLAHRLQSLPTVGKTVADRRRHGDSLHTIDPIRREEARFVKKIARHHLHIISLAEKLKASFGVTILAQFTLCSFILGFTIYRLTSEISNFYQTALMLVFLSAMLTELLLYCWFGNELTLKSQEFSDVIFNIDSTALRPNTRKELLFMLTNSSVPIVIKSGHFVVLSTRSFLKILNLSYSVLNLLRPSSL